MFLRDAALVRVVELMDYVGQRFVMHLLVFENVVRRLPTDQTWNRGIDQSCAFEGGNHALVAGTPKALDLRPGRPIGPLVCAGNVDGTGVDAAFEQTLEHRVQRRFAERALVER